MAWFKIDDNLWAHPKFLGLSAPAFRLWVRSGAYSAQHLTDGIVTKEMLAILGGTRRHCDELWAAGLWEKIADGGYRFHDWADYQPSKADVKARREATRQRVNEWRQKQKPNGQ